jgi:hypothetical protein
MAKVKARAKKSLSQEEKVQRLTMMLGDDPSLDVSVRAIYDRFKDTDERLARLVKLAGIKGRAISL